MQTPFKRGDTLMWKRKNKTQHVIYIEPIEGKMSRIINQKGFLMVVYDFELSAITMEPVT